MIISCCFCCTPLFRHRKSPTKRVKICSIATHVVWQKQKRARLDQHRLVSQRMRHATTNTTRAVMASSRGDLMMVASREDWGTGIEVTSKLAEIVSQLTTASDAHCHSAPVDRRVLCNVRVLKRSVFQMLHSGTVLLTDQNRERVDSLTMFAPIPTTCLICETCQVHIHDGCLVPSSRSSSANKTTK